MPLWPHFLNLNGDGKAAPVLRSVLMYSPGNGWPAYFAEQRFRVEGIDVRRPAVEKKMNDPFGFAGKLRGFREKRIQTLRRVRRRQEQAGFAEQSREAHRAEAHPAFRQEIAPRLKRVS